jgi:hypothetical protein
MNHRRGGEAAERFAARRKREDDAPRLLARVPLLESLRIDVSDGGPVADSVYIRRIVVASAPALFAFPCGDHACKDGGHDVTNEVMGALLRHETQFAGEDACGGTLGTARCARVLRWAATATYREGPVGSR